jgi:inner membrane protease ATP23
MALSVDASAAPNTLQEEPAPPLSAADRASCESLKVGALESRKVALLLRAMRRKGCDVDPKTFIRCDSCGPALSGAVHRDEDGYLEVVMCGNRQMSQRAFNIVLTHELVHAYDHCRAQLDWTDLRHHACTEVRAANLSGDCAFVTEFLNTGNLNIVKHHPVRRAAGSCATRCPHSRSAFYSRDTVYT